MLDVGHYRFTLASPVHLNNTRFLKKVNFISETPKQTDLDMRLSLNCFRYFGPSSVPETFKTLKKMVLNFNIKTFR